MQYAIETSNAAVGKLLIPMLACVETFNGWINTTRYSAENVVADNIHKEALLNLIKSHPNSDLFEIGCGGGHIWIAIPSGFDHPLYRLQPGDRVAIITDEIN